MTKNNVLLIISTGFAMFSMFFGAGNVVFPLAVGQYAQNQNLFAIMGLLITAIVVPFLGLFAMTLYDGNYKNFFSRMGELPGFIICFAIMGLIGPFGAIPRCIVLSYSTSKLFFPSIPLELFSIISCLVIYLFTFRRTKIMDILGNILTPFLLLSLGIIIVKSLIFSHSAPIKDASPFAIFLSGLKEGYQTMDLLGAFFFSSVITVGLKKHFQDEGLDKKKNLMPITLGSIFIGASLLALVYIGFSYASSFNSEALKEIPPDQIIGALAIEILGPQAGIVACTAVALACLTTAIALAAVSAEYIHKDLSFNKIRYKTGLILTLVISYLISTLNFTGIVSILAPILEVCYPALILLTILNILHKLWGIDTVRVPVFLLFFVSLGTYLFNTF